MATEINQSCFAWPQEESSVQDSSPGAAQVFDHGSISFGRFDLESLAWEKWSVFTNDRRNEEFVKFSGLVAKKKAYFEEYFKRIRELKALQQQNQQTELNLEYSGDGSDSSQTGEDELVVEHVSPAGSGTVIDETMEQTAAETTCEPELECYKDQNGSLNNEISATTRSSSVGGLQIISQETRENPSAVNCSDRMDMLQQNSKCSQDDLGNLLVPTMNPKRTIKKGSRISQASKIIPKTVKMTSSYIPDHTVVNKGPDSCKSSVIDQNTKPGNVQSLRRPKAAASNVVGTTGRSKLMGKEAPGVIAVKRPLSAASQRPSTSERRPVTRGGSQKPAEITTLRRPSTAERRPATRELAPKQANNAAPRRPSTADRRPMAKEPAPMNDNIATPRRPSTAERRPITRDTAPKHVGIVSPCWPSTAERCPVTRETAQKHADVVTLRRPFTAERRPITRDTAPKHASVIPSCRPSTAERRPVARETALKHANVSSPCWPSTPERRISRESVPKHAGISNSPCRPSTGERRPITKESTIKSDPKTPLRLRAHPKGAMSTAVTPKKSITPDLVKSRKPEIKSYVKERMELQVDGKQKSSSVNLPPRNTLTNNARANGVLENIRRPTKEGIQETVRSRVSASKIATPLQSGNVKIRAPNPPPPPPPPHRPSQIVSKQNLNNMSDSGRKPKASAPHWH